MDVLSDEVSESTSDPWKPTPDNFDLYLPWACHQLQLGIELNVVNVQVNDEDTPTRKKAKLDKITPIQEKKSCVSFKENDVSYVTIYTEYDSHDKLIKLKFDKNKIIPKLLLKTIQLIVHYQDRLSNITINRGLDQAAVTELNNLLSLTRITDICLDNTVDVNYDILLEKENHLRHLSLSRCKIEDDLLKKIASKLTHPLPASKTLSILNLASNRITDKGAKYLAEALRTNKQLVYLNLADNSLTDAGSEAILDVLHEFVVTWEEIKVTRSGYFAYLKAGGFEQPTEQKAVMKKSAKNPANSARKSKTVEKEMFLINDDFKDPFSSGNVVFKDDQIYCYGNNSLAYLNLAYNYVSYLTVKKLLAVLLYQKGMERMPRGLVNVVLEGNCVPEHCIELNKINCILLNHIFDFDKVQSGDHRKKKK